MKRIVVLGGGFAGLWSAIGAARRLDEEGIGPDRVRVTLVERNDFHAIRVRNYEDDLDATTVPLSTVLDPVGVERIRGEATAIDADRRIVQVRREGEEVELRYDRLVYALGSRLWRPPIPGLGEHGFDIDTYEGAKRLQAHLRGLAATPVIGSVMGEEARAVIAEALDALGVKVRTGVRVAAVDSEGVALEDGSRIDASTVVWCAGMRAHALGASLPGAKDELGRIEVDAFMRVRGVPDLFAAGDAARAVLDGEHASMMSCQHSRPMGRYAGHNAAADLLGRPLLPLRIPWYATVLDLGAWGAVYTRGWERQVIATRELAKETKMTINRRRVYPPLNGDRRSLLEAAAPLVQGPPPVGE
ncbi:FAD-dependent oxidoreductase [uncultured Pigmentiphaga sp.]|uniref:NAD(P)/FAD-dependent oxidoreductase n=2 Tax=Pigmentiphaga TaxID=152267 RepID=UPI0026324367|nr:FAD-dependent oxidoreductase [uncultured Pigmentiphaga sp.]